MRIQILGCSGGIGAGLRTTSLLIDEVILIDCGTGVGDLGIEALSKIRHVFLTHVHVDHIAALPLLVATLFERFMRQPLTVHCQRATYRSLKRHIFNSEIWPDFFELPAGATPVMAYRPLNSGESIQVCGLSVEPIKVNHSIPALAYRVEGQDGTAFAFSGDTSTNDSLWSALNRHRRLDLLLVECAFPEAERALSGASGHYCPSLLANDLAKLKSRPRVCISHLKPGAEQVTMNELQTRLSEFEVQQLVGGEMFEL